MKRQDTLLAATGAEFLVLGNLLIEGIPAYKSYTNMQGYDLVAYNPELKSLVRIQVKSRWTSKPSGFLIKNFDCDILVLALLNRGTKDKKIEPSTPKYYVIPIDIVKKFPRSESWGKINLNKSRFQELEKYENQWGIIKSKLKISEN